MAVGDNVAALANLREAARTQPFLQRDVQALQRRLQQ